MKAVMISIQPKWVEKIANGQKTIEVRKTRPKIDTPFKCYIYCTFPKKPVYTLWLNRGKENRFLADGKVIGEFVCDWITDISVSVRNCNEDYNHVYHNDECKGSCLTWKELQEYGKGKPLYAWHISDLVIYDEPKELSEFRLPCSQKQCASWCKDMKVEHAICLNKGKRFMSRPPQSWQFVEEKE